MCSKIRERFCVNVIIIVYFNCFCVMWKCVKKVSNYWKNLDIVLTVFKIDQTQSSEPYQVTDQPERLFWVFGLHYFILGK